MDLKIYQKPQTTVLSDDETKVEEKSLYVKVNSTGMVVLNQNPGLVTLKCDREEGSSQKELISIVAVFTSLGEMILGIDKQCNLYPLSAESKYYTYTIL